MHEIITLQLGQQANYVGTHFWNTQESYFTYGDEEQSPVNHDVHFRPGIGAGGVDTFTPRALIYDLKGGFGSMRRMNALYEIDDGTSAGVWDRKTVVQKEKPIEQIPYQRDLEAGTTPESLTPDNIRYWSDFNRVYYHPRSMVQINEYELNSTITPFEGFNLGRELFKDLNREHDLIDRDFRLFAEECDQMQGVQVITSSDDAWGGFAADYVAELRDEYGKIGICTWGLERGEKANREVQLQRTVALANTLSAIVPFASLYVPVRQPPSSIQSDVRLLRACQWHTSALISAAIETVTLPTRMHHAAGAFATMENLHSMLNTSGRQNIGLLALSLYGHDKSDSDEASSGSRPAPRSRKDAAQTTQLSWEREMRRGRGRKNHTFARADVVRGFDFDAVLDDDLTEPSDNGAAPEQTDARRDIYRSFLPFPVIDSFPDIFPTFQSPVTDSEEIKKYTAVDTSLTTSSQVIDRLVLVKDVAARAVGIDEREALVNDLGEMIEAYEEGWDSDSDEMDD